MNLTYTRTGELRKPDIEVLPDNRLRITRYIAVGHGDRDLSEITETVGTADGGLATALLVKRAMGRFEGKDVILKTYEVRNASSETQVGREDVQFGENGLKTVINDFVQMSSGTYTPEVIGTTTSSYDATCVLKNEQMEDDGTSRIIRRTYINKGLLSQTDERHNNGALLMKTMVYLNDAPSPNPPTGYALVATKVDNPNGLETTTYTFAKGNGQISIEAETHNGGALLIQNIRYIASSTSANPISVPSGYSTVSEAYVEQDGHRIWTSSFAKGDGKISQNNETRLSGMLLRSTIVWLTASSVTTQPTADPLSGGTIVSQEYADRDGHRVWTVIWAKGVTTSDVVVSTEYKNNGALIIYKKRKLGASPTAPAATISGTVVLIEDSTQLEDGYTLYEKTWAEGVGTISNSIAYHNGGKLVIYHITALAVTPTAPTATIGGTVVIIEDNSRKSDGVTVYDRTWAEGIGVYGKRIQQREGGLRTETWDSLGTLSFNAATQQPTNGILLSKHYEEGDGVVRWSVTVMQSDAGGNPTSGILLSYGDYADFTYPGRAKAYTETSAIYPAGTGYIHDVYQAPPTTCKVVSTVQVSYQTSASIGALTYALWNPSDWVSFRAIFQGLDYAPHAIVRTLYGYRLVGSSTLSFTASSLAGMYPDICMGVPVFPLSSGNIYMSGGPANPEGNTYTLSFKLEHAFTSEDGTKYYRNTLVYATIPAQAALPV